MNEEEEQDFNKIYSEELDQFKQKIEIAFDQEEGIDGPNQENAESLEPFPATTSLAESSTVTSASAKLSETIAAASILTASALLSATTTALLSSSATLPTTAIPAETKNQIDKPNTHSNGGQPGASVHLNESTSLSMASTVIIWLLKLVFGHVPYFIFRILSTTLSFTVTLDFWTGLYLFCFTVLIGVIVYRYGGLSCLLDHL